MNAQSRQLSPHHLDEVKRRFDLVERIRRDVADLKRQGREWLGRCPFHGGKSFTVVPDKGFWHCFGCGENGDAIDYIRRSTGATFLEAVQEMNGGVEIELSREVREARAAEDQRRAEDIARQQARKRLAAAALWKSSAAIAGTPAERYLIGRGLTPPFPVTLRFQPKCRARWTVEQDGRDRDRSALLPALIALVMAADRTLATVHRIYLEERADGTVGKASVLPAGDVKKLHGPPLDGAVRLSEPAAELVLVEGVETGLAVLEALRERRPVAVWSAISAGQLVRLGLPAAVGEAGEAWRPERITIMADHDPVSGTGRRMAIAACRRFEAMGIPAAWSQPERPGDWLDVLNTAKREVG